MATREINQHIVTIVSWLVVDAVSRSDFIAPDSFILFVLQLEASTGDSSRRIGPEPFITARSVFWDIFTYVLPPLNGLLVVRSERPGIRSLLIVRTGNNI